MESKGEIIELSLDDTDVCEEKTGVEHELQEEGQVSDKTLEFRLNEHTSNEEKDTNRGASAIIYNKETGEFYFELKPDNYPIKEARGKLALVGGHVDSTDPSSLDALIREIREEVVSKKAQEILISALTNLGTYYHTIIDNVDGREVKTDVYLINIDSDEKWKIVKNSKLTEGLKQVLTMNEVHNRLDDFAFKYEEPLIKLINEERDMCYRQTYNHSNHAFPINISLFYNNPTSSLISSTSDFGKGSMALRHAA